MKNPIPTPRIKTPSLMETIKRIYDDAERALSAYEPGPDGEINEEVEIAIFAERDRLIDQAIFAERDRLMEKARRFEENARERARERAVRRALERVGKPKTRR